MYVYVCMSSTLHRRNLKTQLFSTVWPIVHTNPSRKQSFSKARFKPDEYKTPAFRFRVDGKHFENGAFENDDVTIMV